MDPNEFLDNLRKLVEIQNGLPVPRDDAAFEHWQIAREFAANVELLDRALSRGAALPPAWAGEPATVLIGKVDTTRTDTDTVDMTRTREIDMSRVRKP